MTRQDVAQAAVRKRRFRRRRIVAGLAVLAVASIVATIVFVANTYLKVVGNISDNVVARPGQSGPVDGPDWSGPVNLLIMGSDTRDGLTSGDYGQDEAGTRSDVMMLLHVSADHHDATLVSFPRDTMMPIPECTNAEGEVFEAEDEAQINGALNHGPHCSLDAIRDFTGLDVSHFIVVDFDAAINVTNAIGGVDVCVVDDVEDAYSGLSLTAGEHSIKGAQALAFLRTRHGFADGSDLGRISAQQTFLSALARKVKSAGTLSNPVTLFNLADAASKSITVDEALGSVPALAGLAGTLAGVELDRMVLIQLPVEDYWADDNRVQPIADASEQIFAALRADLPLTFDAPVPESPDEDAPALEEPSVPQTPPARSGTSSAVALPDAARGQTAKDTSCAQ
ncbi:LCP family protein [Plantibacter sp. Mn2098]|uniref:LCP family protein n=1 Tax=Plantibacter sp. Mn2098 TaxID=3395266 RepID=UPI003BE7F720